MQRRVDLASSSIDIETTIRIEGRREKKIAALPVLLSELSSAFVAENGVYIDSVKTEYIVVQGKALNALVGFASLHDGSCSVTFHSRIKLDLGAYGTALVKITVIRNQPVYTLETFHAGDAAMAAWWKSHVADIRACRKQQSA